MWCEAGVTCREQSQPRQVTPVSSPPHQFTSQSHLCRHLSFTWTFLVHLPLHRSRCTMSWLLCPSPSPPLSLPPQEPPVCRLTPALWERKELSQQAVLRNGLLPALIGSGLDQTASSNNPALKGQVAWRPIPANTGSRHSVRAQRKEGWFPKA